MLSPLWFLAFISFRGVVDKDVPDSLRGHRAASQKFKELNFCSALQILLMVF